MITNPTIRRLDWAARQLGIDLRVQPNRNTREFVYEGRLFRYKPGGKGVLKVDVFVEGQHEATAHRQPEYIERLFLRIARSR